MLLQLVGSAGALLQRINWKISALRLQECGYESAVFSSVAWSSNSSCNVHLNYCVFLDSARGLVWGAAGTTVAGSLLRRNSTYNKLGSVGAATIHMPVTASVTWKY
jgi:hypothetical protein